MDFVILKVNGQDVSNSSHEDAVRCFQLAQEPIVVEVLRRQPDQRVSLRASSKEPGNRSSSDWNNELLVGTANDESCRANDDDDDEDGNGDGDGDGDDDNEDDGDDDDDDDDNNDNGDENGDEDEEEREETKENQAISLVSTAVQTDWAGLVEEEEEELFSLHLNANQRTNYSFEDFLAHDIDFEEVTLRKSGSEEKLGLTVCYSSGFGSEDADTEIYISEIVPESLAARDGRLREGDQILRVNGKDVANKEQTENLFAETNDSVTILVSRCLYQDEKCDNRSGTYHPQESRSISPRDDNPAYQNSMIEQLIRHQQQQQQQQQQHQQQQQQIMEDRSKENEANASAVKSVTPPPVPSHVIPLQQVTAAAAITTTTTTTSSSCSFKILNKSEQLEKSLVHHSCDDSKRSTKDISRKEIPKMVEGSSSLTLQPRLPGLPVKLVEDYFSRVWSDTEHIYETIPESDSEPIYSSPYEHYRHLCGTRTNLNHENQCQNQSRSNRWAKNQHASSKSNSSGEERDSSSAYNTGESCHSNPLTLELHQRERDRHKSTLVLCPPSAFGRQKQQRQQQQQQHHHHYQHHHQQQQQRKKKRIIGYSCPLSSQAQPKQIKASQSSSRKNIHRHRNRDIFNTITPLPADTMYTNVANLQQTILLQQQLFKQALNRKSSTTTASERKSKFRENFQAPNLTRYQFVGSQQVGSSAATAWTPPEDDGEIQMEWKVKRRPDGTRYIARRPVRNQILRNRAIEILEERAGHTTEDDTVSEMKVGRYWSKEERKRQLERARERKRQEETLTLQQQQQQQQQSSGGDILICDHVEEISKRQPSNIGELCNKKITRKKTTVDDYTTVQEILVHGNKVGGTSNPSAGGKLLGLLSVTTV